MLNPLTKLELLISNVFLYWQVFNIYIFKNTVPPQLVKIWVTLNFYFFVWLYIKNKSSIMLSPLTKLDLFISNVFLHQQVFIFPFLKNTVHTTQPVKILVTLTLLISLYSVAPILLILTTIFCIYIYTSTVFNTENMSLVIVHLTEVTVYGK